MREFWLFRLKVWKPSQDGRKAFEADIGVRSLAAKYTLEFAPTSDCLIASFCLSLIAVVC